jgi:hypothetical protein
MQPEGIILENNDEKIYRIDEILREGFKKQGYGYIKRFLIRWNGYMVPTWKPAVVLLNTIVLDK